MNSGRTVSILAMNIGPYVADWSLRRPRARKLGVRGAAADGPTGFGGGPSAIEEKQLIHVSVMT